MFSIKFCLYLDYQIFQVGKYNIFFSTKDVLRLILSKIIHVLANKEMLTLEILIIAFCRSQMYIL